jgi:hypothetical protein
MKSRRRIACPEAQEYANMADYIRDFAEQQSRAAHVRFGSKADIAVECAPNGGHLAGMELTKAAGLSEDESHGQATFP